MTASIDTIVETTTTAITTTTVSFSPKDAIADVKEGLRKVSVGSKSTKDADGKTIPPKFSPFSLILPSAYCAPVLLAPEAFRPAIFDALDAEVRRIASEAKIAGRESCILATDAARQLLAAGESTRLSIANIQTWFDRVVAPSFSPDLPNRDKVVLIYRGFFSRLAPNSSVPNQENLEKLALRLSKIEGEDAFTTRILERLEAEMIKTDELLPDVE